MGPPGTRITPEQVIALNDEITSLVRAGVPLELGLRSVGTSVSGALGKISQRLEHELQSGRSLGDSMSNAFPDLPRVYTAVVDAGLKSGNLPGALESITEFVRRGIELRRRVELAFIYPLVVLAIAYTLFAVFITEAIPRLVETWSPVDPALGWSVSWLIWLSESARYWIWIGPVIVFVLLGGWVLLARHTFLPDRRPSYLLCLIPGLRGAMSMLHWSNFCDLLSMLLAHQVPLPEALLTASEASGDRQLRRQIEIVASRVQEGHSLSESIRQVNGLPPYLLWALVSSTSGDELVRSLQYGADLYRRRSVLRADLIKTWLPIILVVVIGGGATLIYALSLALPLRALFMQLDQDTLR